MGRKSHESFEKRRLEKLRQERQAAKRDRKEARQQVDGDKPDEAALMERFRVLSERHATGQIDASAYEAERREIFVALGLEQPAE